MFLFAYYLIFQLFTENLHLTLIFVLYPCPYFILNLALSAIIHIPRNHSNLQRDFIRIGILPSYNPFINQLVAHTEYLFQTISLSNLMIIQ